MESNIRILSCRVVAILFTCSTVLVANLWADPVTVTSGVFVFGRAPTAAFTFSGVDGFFLHAAFVPVGFVRQSCPPAGCRAGDTFDLSTVAGAGSGGNTSTLLPAAFTLGTAVAATVNGTEFGQVGLAGSLRFDTPPLVLPSSDIVAPGQPNPFSVPFAFNGHVVGFRSTDVDARTPLFSVTLTGRGTGFSDFEQDTTGVFRSDIFRFTFEATPAATPEPATLALLGTGLFGLFAHARRRQRRD